MPFIFWMPFIVFSSMCHVIEDDARELAAAMSPPCDRDEERPDYRPGTER